MSIFKRKSVIAGIALLAVGALLGAWITAKTGQFPFSYSHVQASAADIADGITLKTGFGPIVKKVQPAVVSVLSTQNVKVSQNDQQLPDNSFFRQFFGNQFGQPFEAPPQERQRRGLGSGVITSADGYILTNNHVVENADEVKVSLSDGRELPAKIIGTDPESDLAVLKIDATNLPVVEFGDSSHVDVGDVVLAMGNPFGVGQTVTMGIVGATARRGLGIEDYEDFIQTDAAINPGNSGGALVNMNGELVGINTAIISGGGGFGGEGGNQGVGFAIPVNMAKNVMSQIVDHGKVSRGWLGVLIQGVTPEIAKQFNLPGEPRGALVGDVTADSPAAKAGLKRGDIVVAMNGQKVPDSIDLRLRVGSMKPNSTADLDIYRDGKEQQIAVNLGEKPSDQQISSNAPNSQSNGSGPQLGIQVQAITPQIRQQMGLRAGVNGLVIAGVQQGSPAAEADLHEGDVIQEVNRTAIHDVNQFRDMVHNSTGPLLLLINRDGQTHFVTVKPR